MLKLQFYNATKLDNTFKINCLLSFKRQILLKTK